MTVICPHCGLARDVDPARLPRGPARVTCPRCRESFAWPGPAPATAAVAEPPAADPADPRLLPKAGFWIRALAATLDALLIGIVESLLGPLLFRLGGLDPARSGAEGVAALGVAGLFAAVLGYAYRVYFIGCCGQTPGKMAARVKVIRREGGEVGYGRALLREVLGKFLSKLILGIGYLMVAFDPQKQGLHDKIADTYVIKL